MKILPAGDAAWAEGREAIRRGELVAFPTDTVYGIACDPYNTAAIERLYASKGRSREKAIPLLLSGVDQLERVATSFPAAAERLGRQFWPGALTLVVPRVPSLPRELSGTDTVAVRVPDLLALREFILSCGGALATTSANLSGQPDATTAGRVASYLGEHVALIIDGGPSPGGTPSTVVNCAVEPLSILREGAIPREKIEGALRS